jgi:hypothetical protein
MDKSFFDAYLEFPPVDRLRQVIDKTCHIYLFLWKKKDANHRVKMTWKQVDHFYNKNNFRTALRNLKHRTVLDYTETESGVVIELFP